MRKVRQPASDPSRGGEALHDVIARVRELIELSVTAEAPDAALAAAGRHIARAVAALAPFPRGPGRRTPPAAAKRDDPAQLMPFDPVLGHLSPLAPPLVVRWEPPRAVGEVTFGGAYEGPPGCVHGGFIAAAFDQVFNVMNLMLGTPGPTASLALQYRRPTPLGTPLLVEGWQDRVDGRRIHVRGRLLVGDQVTVEADGVFVVLPVDRIMRMLAPDHER
jgi:acyl-coenzyme A thioesterase PaaI-like protein